MTPILALLSLVAAPQDWTALPLPSLARPHAVVELERPAPDGRHLRFGRYEPQVSTREEEEVSATTVVQWLQEEARRRGSQLTVSPSAPPLLVSGTEEDVAWARAAVEGLDAVGRRLAVELDAWLVPAALDSDPGDEALAAIEGARQWSARVGSGDEVLFGEPRRRSFLADFDVEVSTDSGVSAPVVGQVLTGEQLHLAAFRVDAGRAVLLRGVLDLAELAGIEDFDPGTPDLGRLEQPLVDVAQVTFSGRVESGDALRVALSGCGVGGGEWTLLVRATTEADPRTSREFGWTALDLSLLAADETELHAVHAGGSLERHAHLPGLAGIYGGTPPPGVLALLGRDRRRELERPPVRWTQRLLLVHESDAERRAELVRLVAQLESQRAATTRCVVEHGSLRVELPIAAGVPARVLVGRERTLLTGYHAEIAPNTWMPSPRTRTVYDGIAWQARLSGETLTGSCFRTATVELRTKPRGDASLGAMQLPERRHSASRGRVGAGERAVWLPASDEDEALVVSRASS